MDRLFADCVESILFVFLMPIALANIGWMFYMINGGWDILMLLAIIFFWVETKGKTLEEMDEIIEYGVDSSLGDIGHRSNGLEESQKDVVTKAGPRYT
jgi:hypothetical protein